MILVPFIWLLVYGSVSAILGVITLACVPQWRVNKREVLTFMLGGFIGVLVLGSTEIQCMIYFTERAGLHANAPYGTILAYLVMLLSG